MTNAWNHVKAADYKRLEVQLRTAEAIFTEETVYGTKALTIREELRELIAEVVAERVKAEDREDPRKGG
jgi:hypothetical protein